LNTVRPPAGHDRNADQIAYWNGVAGRHWTDRQSVQDVLLAPVTEKLIARVAARPDQRILDIGCGTGAISIALARQVAPSGHVLGIDISVPMLERARQLTPKDLPADYVLADATVYPFDPQSFDLLVSRFGVMFFADPVLSFRNLRKALRPTGKLVFACWREPRENGWMMTPLMAPESSRHGTTAQLTQHFDPSARSQRSSSFSTVSPASTRSWTCFHASGRSGLNS